METRRWDDDERGQGVADARDLLPSIAELASLAETPNWVAEEPDKHLLPGLRERIEISGLSLDAVEVRPGGELHVALSSGTKLSPREIRQSVWSILGGAVEMSTLVRESHPEGKVVFEVVTGNPPGGHFATHGHTMHIEVAQPG